MQGLRPAAQAAATPVAAAGPRPAHTGSPPAVIARTEAAALKALEPTPSPLRLLMQGAPTDPLAKQALRQKLIAGITTEEFSTFITEFPEHGLHHNASLAPPICLMSRKQGST
jgi:hypothetical protein